jgi:multiple sugar transport system ATP-binding protein
MAKVVLDGITKRFGEVVAVDQVALEIDDGEFMVLVGPSGCGKSTILRIVAGLEELTAGEIWIGDRQVTDLSPRDRDVAMVFQNYALYPHMTVEQNLGIGLKLRHTPKDEIRRRVGNAAKILALEPLLGRKPAELSGGQRQRVAMGRAMVREPKVFLMDEPLSNLDAKLRVQMRAELSRLRERLQTTTIYVTHDQVEAMTLGDRVAVLKDGVLQQVDTPTTLFNDPANLFVAAFIGSPSMNLVHAVVKGRAVEFGSWSIPMPTESAAGAVSGGEVILGIRPSDFQDATLWSSDLPVVDVTAEVTEELGSEINVIFTIDAPPVITEDTVAAASEDAAEGDLLPLGDAEGTTSFTARVDARSAAKPGSRLRLSVDPTRFHFFDPETGRTLDAGREPGELPSSTAR